MMRLHPIFRFSSAELFWSLAIFVFVCWPGHASADEIYKWKDSEGIVHFSSKAPSSDAKPAELPEINKADFKVAAPKLISCSDHGGIDCQAGPDTDGSVICFDGFRKASPRYRFSCNSPKLEVAEITADEAGVGFTVFVRNARSVAAKGVNLLFQLPEESVGVKLDGPEKVDAFGVAEYTYLGSKETPLPDPITIAHLNIECANCP